MSGSAQPCIWLIGGTSESAQLARSLSKHSLPYIVTVTTASAIALYPPTAQVLVARLTQPAMAQLVERWQVRGILDASHPFASEVSRQAMAIAQAQAIAYLRYERTDIGHRDCNPAYIDDGSVVFVDSINALVDSDILERHTARPQRVLFTLGYRTLLTVVPLRKTAQLFARVLPSPAAISGAIAAGFSSHEIMALRPPVSPALEAALWRQWQITHVVAKASGDAGGEQTKRAIAAELGVVLILIRRPRVIYPNQTNSISAATEFCSKTLKVY